MTGNQLIASSLRLAKVLASGDTPTASQVQDALLIANQMIEQWTTEELMIFTITMNEYALIAGQQTYTLGTGGNFNNPRPSRIQNISIVSLNNPAQPLELPMEMLTDEGWEAIPVKNIQGSLPLKVYDDGAFPLRNISYYTIPSIAANTRIYSWTSLTQFPDLVTDITFPPGYAKALRYCLAVDLAPEFGTTLDQTVILQAVMLKAGLKSLNMDVYSAHCDPAVLTTDGYYDWRSDTIVGRNNG